MATGKFHLQQPYIKTSTGKKVLNPKETRIYLLIIIGFKQVIKIKTPYVIYPKEWDKSKQLKNEKLSGAIEFNKKLRAFKEDFLNSYDKTLKDHPDYSFATISRTLTDSAKNIGKPNADNKAFFDVLDEFIESKRGQVAEGTIKKYTTLKNSLHDFGSLTKEYKNLEFSMINHAFKNAYRKYLRNRKPQGKQKSRPEEEQQFGLYVDTQAKYFETLKTFCKWASEEGYNKHTTYTEFANFEKADVKKKKSKIDIVTLSIQELKQFASHQFKKGSPLQKVQDIFLFGVYTGQRWGDVAKFDKMELHGDVWSFTSEKTLEQVNIDLIGFAGPALEILARNNNELPKMSLTKFNFYIKKAMKDAKINTPITLTRYVGTDPIKITRPKCDWIGSHCARRTCVSLLLNVYNMPVTHVMEITKHADLKTLQKYIDPDRQARREAMSKTKDINEVMIVTHNKKIKAG